MVEKYDKVSNNIFLVIKNIVFIENFIGEMGWRYKFKEKRNNIKFLIVKKKVGCVFLR